MSFLKHLSGAKYHHKPYYDTRHLDHRMPHHRGRTGPAVFSGLLECIIGKKAIAIPIVIGVLVVGVGFIILCVFAVLKLLPLVAPLFRQFEQVGVNGLVDTAIGIIRAILAGGGKG
jgi:hypothetical protein